MSNANDAPNANTAQCTTPYDADEYDVDEYDVDDPPSCAWHSISNGYYSKYYCCYLYRELKYLTDYRAIIHRECYISHQADCDCMDLMHYAMRYENLYLVDLLITAGYNMNKRYGSITILCECVAMVDSHQIVDTLIKAGVDLNARVRFNDTALIIAAYYNRWSACNALLRNGADYTLLGQHEYTALQWAKDRGHTQCAALIRAYEHLDQARMAHAISSRYQRSKLMERGIWRVVLRYL